MDVIIFRYIEGIGVGAIGLLMSMKPEFVFSFYFPNNIQIQRENDHVTKLLGNICGLGTAGFGVTLYLGYPYFTKLDKQIFYTVVGFAEVCNLKTLIKYSDSIFGG